MQHKYTQFKYDGFTIFSSRKYADKFMSKNILAFWELDVVLNKES